MYETSLLISVAKDIKIDKWSSSPGDIYGNVDGGFPLVVFNAAMDTALVLSPATTFMSANQYSFKDDQTGETVLTFGPMSSIDEVSVYMSESISCGFFIHVKFGSQSTMLFYLPGTQ